MKFRTCKIVKWLCTLWNYKTTLDNKRHCNDVLEYVLQPNLISLDFENNK